MTRHGLSLLTTVISLLSLCSSLKASPVPSIPEPTDDVSSSSNKSAEVAFPKTVEPILDLSSLDGSNSSHMTIVYTCDESNSHNWFIFCSGKLLEAVMAHGLYEDSKTFVDKPLVKDPNTTFAEFNKRFPMPVKEINTNELMNFVNEYFLEEGTELQPCNIPDWKEDPLTLTTIADPVLRQWASELNSIWKKLCREMDPNVKSAPEKYSLLYVPNRFIVPGGRFREFYYWDAYWIIKGLIASGMHETTKLMIQNFAHIVDQYGFVPNGGRVYYLQRSQPPMLTPMVYEYFEATRDTDFVRSILPTLEKELQFWDAHRKVNLTMNGKDYEVYQYRSDSNVPRPESYREDVEVVKQFTKEADKRHVWRDIASAAESGWDFSSRWFADHQAMKSIETTNIAPVDLNAFICWNMNILSYLYDEIGDEVHSEQYRTRMSRFRNVFQKVFYVKERSGWYDYNLRSKEHNFEFYPSIAIPLFTKCYHSMNHAQSDRLFNKMEQMGVLNYTGGIPTSLAKSTNQQWDFPNGWSPLNHMIIEGLRKSENSRMQEKAYRLAQKWVLSNYRVFASSGSMWEKYSVIGTQPKSGNGGEYEVQAGFGWTNGAILDLLVTYSDRISFPSVNPPLNSDRATRVLLAESKAHSDASTTLLGSALLIFSALWLI
ncbi:hypothetical protein L596_001708 [Steinernema carpocapsae]|uniref:Trehalase n=1 Tax=Steinernema carpocapsae TaxID=34508 RepID=A0A4U8UQX4_STECR|nr:hypothetical protein L596_001708 [Steinernema carpocapsae]